ncbi:hypothetical protein HA466_0104530 [Hirschfeldia incana]|nr:hypothetical protein HA466_0104530 [Hirschfeldia incana]
MKSSKTLNNWSCLFSSSSSSLEDALTRPRFLPADLGKPSAKRCLQSSIKQESKDSIKSVIIPKRGTIELPRLEKRTLSGFLRIELFGFLLRTLNHQSNGKRTSKRSEIVGKN